MIIFSLKEDKRDITDIPDPGFFLEGDKNLCFLIHGITGTPREMGAIAHKLHNKGFTVAAPMLASHNKSLSTLKRTTWQEFYARLKDELNKLEGRFDNIFIGGLSFGALLGLKLAHELPEKIKALVCFSPTLFFDGWGTPKSKVLLPLAYHTPLKYYLYLKEGFPYGIKNPRLRSKVEAYYKNSSLFDYGKVELYGYPAIPVSCVYENHKLAKHISRLLPKITCPIRLLQAKEDDIASPANSYFIYERIGSKDKRVIILENSYHIIIADDDREKVAQESISFFEKYK